MHRPETGNCRKSLRAMRKSSVLRFQKSLIQPQLLRLEPFFRASHGNNAWSMRMSVAMNEPKQPLNAAKAALAAGYKTVAA